MATARQQAGAYREMANQTEHARAVTRDYRDRMGRWPRTSVALLAFALSCRFAVGSLLFQAAPVLGFRNAFIILGIAAGIGAAFAFRLLCNRPPRAVHTAV